jgi:hypothetical protein
MRIRDKFKMYPTFAEWSMNVAGPASTCPRGQAGQVLKCSPFEFQKTVSPMSLTTSSKHQIAVEVDSWAIVHLVMPQIIPDSHEWLKAVSARTEVPLECFGIVSVKRHQFNQQFCLHLRSMNIGSKDAFISQFRKNFAVDSASIDSEKFLADFFRIPNHFMRSGGPPDTFLNAVFSWYEFLKQNHFRPYWDDIEGVGISVMRDFFPPYDLRLLYGFLEPLPASIRDALPPKFIRDSRTIDHYIGGPLSLANHACSKHSNCVLRVTDGHVCLAADTFIMVGQRVYICYDSNEQNMLTFRGFKCAVCVRYH